MAKQYPTATQGNKDPLAAPTDFTKLGGYTANDSASTRPADNKKDKEEVKDLKHSDIVKTYDDEAVKYDDEMRHAMDVYKPLCAKVGLASAASMYKKHEYNKAWKQSVADRNLQLMCQGTLAAMEKSQRENEMLNHERMYGPHGLLR